MPINDTFHIEYQYALPDWEVCRDLAGGERRVKAAGEKYLPRLTGQSDKEYNAYRFRAALLGAFGRTVEGLGSMVFRKPATRDLAASVAKYEADIDNQGTSLDAFALAVVREMLTTGRCGILVNFNGRSKGDLTIAEAERANLRPVLLMYPAETILDWRTSRINNRLQLSMVKLREIIQRPSADDPWKLESVVQYRVLELVGGKFYEDAVYQEAEGGEWIEVARVRPMFGGRPLGYIPFEIVGGLSVGKPPLLDLAYVNLSHYRHSADYENGLHWSGVPTPVFVGSFADVGPDGLEVKEVTLGSSAGVHLREGSAFFLEYQGNGLEGGLGLAMDRAVENMAKLGARLLEDQKRAAESYETVALNRQSETSILAAVANTVSQSIVRCLGWFALWTGSNEPSSYWLSSDYLPIEMSAQELTALLAAWQGGLVSMPEALERLKAGEIIRPDKSLVDHMDELQEDVTRQGAIVEAVAKHIGGTK